MKYIWVYAFCSIFVVLLCSSYLSFIEPPESFTNSSITGISDSSNNIISFSNNLDVQYHVQEQQLRTIYDQPMIITPLKADNGSIIPVKMEKPQPFPLYYTPGTFRYGASSFVPNYEDTVRLSNAKGPLFFSS